MFGKRLTCRTDLLRPWKSGGLDFSGMTILGVSAGSGCFRGGGGPSADACGMAGGTFGGGVGGASDCVGGEGSSGSISILIGFCFLLKMLMAG
ncbi:MAG: hypothetical protein HOK49_01440 [Opitutae bacterium]|nr:hypothetical protein [Opitutae bacterium]MBT6461177.1 hypothetical protein [Opitutae bacterium]